MSDADAAERERRSFATRVSLLFAAIFTVAGTSMPYLPVWLDWTGLGAREIAIVTAAPLFVRVAVTPVIAVAADQAGDHRRFLIGLAWAGLAALLLLSQARGFWQILTCALLFALAWTTVMPLTETVAMSGVKTAGLDYGRMRLWGSLSFIAASLGGGWVVEGLGPSSAIWLVVFGMALTTCAAHGLAAPIGLGRLGAAKGMPRLDSAHAVLNTFGVLHWRSLGLSAGWCGALWAISIVSEVALFAYSRAVLVRISPVGLITVAAGAALLRWTVMGFDPPLALLLPLQTLHGVTFGATHLGAIHFMGRTVPEGQAGTAQALYASVTSGIAMGGAMLLAGPLYAAYAGHAYWAMAVLAAVGLSASLVLRRRPQ
jgi:PPP family 3-phenylpropionic acid transporter